MLSVICKCTQSCIVPLYDLYVYIRVMVGDVSLSNPPMSMIVYHFFLVFISFYLTLVLHRYFPLSPRSQTAPFLLWQMIPNTTIPFPFDQFISLYKRTFHFPFDPPLPLCCRLFK
ncbi:hypothetical protein M413DRAFT_242806 [Hebeloma cylindrosporum]|uniref:Uncharacterized protein n=1 Tax=Hebeloma cylindrosporum TaxID=76867 RepID=A0A0C2XLA3_HEBCY|nr:hypothetical protein M413DRAFT_242806 [Hebeloma cylindrosporum h7]